MLQVQQIARDDETMKRSVVLMSVCFLHEMVSIYELPQLSVA